MEDSLIDRSLDAMIRSEEKVEGVSLDAVNPYLRSLIIVVKGIDSYLTLDKNIVNSEMFPNIRINTDFQKQYVSLKDRHFNEFLKNLELIPTQEFTTLVDQSIFKGDPIVGHTLTHLLDYFLQLEEYEKCAKTQLYLNLLK